MNIFRTGNVNISTSGSYGANMHRAPDSDDDFIYYHWGNLADCQLCNTPPRPDLYPPLPAPPGWVTWYWYYDNRTVRSCPCRTENGGSGICGCVIGGSQWVC